MEDVSFSVKAGEFFTLLGLSGCGKTTLLDGIDLIGSGNPNLDAMPYIKLEIAYNAAIFPDRERLAKLEILKDLDRNQRRVLSRMWTEIKLR